MRRMSAEQAQQELNCIVDQYYIPTRYPNGLPGGIPHEVYTDAQAGEAVSGAGQVLDLVVRLL